MNFAQLLFPDFFLILCGFLLCRYTPLDRRLWDQVEGLVYYFLFPVLLFQSITRSPLDLRATSSLIGAGLALASVTIALAYALPHLPVLGRHIERRQHAAAAQVSFRFNSYIALALADRLAGAQGLLLVAVLIGVSVPVCNMAAVWPMARQANTGFARALVRNPLIVGTAAGLATNFAGLTIPSFMEPAVTRIGAAALALGLMAAGAGMSWSSLKSDKVLTVSLLSIRHLAAPLAAFGLARAFRLDATQTKVLLTFAALPTASSTYVLAARMGYDGPYVAGLVTLSTVLGIASLSFAVGLLR